MFTDFPHTGVTANSTRYKEFTSGFDTIAPVTFYYENSPYVDVITKKLKEHYIKKDDFDSMSRQILEVSIVNIIHFTCPFQVQINLRKASLDVNAELRVKSINSQYCIIYNCINTKNMITFFLNES